jgi:hypothetical protein
MVAKEVYKQQTQSRKKLVHVYSFMTIVYILRGTNNASDRHVNILGARTEPYL